MALATFLHRLRPQTLPEQRAQSEYRAQVEDIARRLQAVLDDWMALREIEPDNARLANAAAVNRWELMRVASQAKQLDPPRTLAHVHRNVTTAVVGCARACQLLANGYRFHKSEAVCDGQAMLVETVSGINSLLADLQVRS